MTVLHCKTLFLSTPSLRRATALQVFHAYACQFLSTLSLRRATRGGHISKARSKHFYPRSPCGERRQKYINRRPNHVISIHALLAESDAKLEAAKHMSMLFLSTLSLRRATHLQTSNHPHKTFLSTLSLRRATAKVHKTVGHFSAYETNFMGIASSC